MTLPPRSEPDRPPESSERADARLWDRLTELLPRGSPTARGVLLGLLTVLVWAVYNVGAKWGTARGFRALDLTLLRYAVAGVLVLPFLRRMGVRDLGGLGWRRGLGLALAAGPLFGLLVNTGFRHAPLAHGVVLGPAATMFAGLGLSWRFAGERPRPSQLAGMGLLIGGLVAMALDGAGAGGRSAVWLGDAAFLGSGTLWGLFTFLLRRWRVGALQAVAAVSLPSLVVFVPVYFALTGGQGPPASWTEIGLEAVYQGVLGGFIGVVAYGAVVRLLGVARASLFPALVPAVATAIGVAVLGEAPRPLQLLGIGVSTLGLMIAFGVFGMMRRPDSTPPG